MDKHIALAWFSGTGGTERVARCLGEQLKSVGHVVQMIPLRVGKPTACEPHDRLVVLFAVHAMNAPAPVCEWLDNLPAVSGVKAAVLSVSGGGEVSPNTACRMGCIRRLQRKGYLVDDDEMLVMPSNWIVATREPLARMLLETLPKRVSRIITNWEACVTKRAKPRVFDRFFSYVGQLEHLATARFGRRIGISDACTGCGRCVAICPRGNIQITDGKPVFAAQCVMCLGCIYGCPQKALQPTSMKWIVVPEGYDLAALERMGPMTEPIDVPALTRGYLWSGVRKYLMEDL